MKPLKTIKNKKKYFFLFLKTIGFPSLQSTNLHSSITQWSYKPNWKFKKSIRCDYKAFTSSLKKFCCFSCWNSLTQDKVDAPSVNSFKSHGPSTRLRF